MVGGGIGGGSPARKLQSRGERGSIYARVDRLRRVRTGTRDPRADVRSRDRDDVLSELRRTVVLGSTRGTRLAPCYRSGRVRRSCFDWRKPADQPPPGGAERGDALAVRNRSKRRRRFVILPSNNTSPRTQVSIWCVAFTTSESSGGYDPCLSGNEKRKNIISLSDSAGTGRSRPDLGIIRFYSQSTVIVLLNALGRSASRSVLTHHFVRSLLNDVLRAHRLPRLRPSLRDGSQCPVRLLQCG